MEQLLSAVDQICTFLIYGYYYSFKTGQFFVYLTKLIVDNSIVLLNICVGATIIVLESLAPFLQDVVHGFLQFTNFFMHFLEDTNSGIVIALSILKDLGDTLNSLVTTLCRIPGHTILTLWITVIQAIVLCKNMLVLFGSGVWFAITFIPYTLTNLVHLCIDCIKNGYYELVHAMFKLVSNTKKMFSNSYEFITDVPVESLLGIIVATSLIYIFSQFYIIIFTYFYYQTRNTFIKIYRKLSRLRNRMRIRFHSYFQRTQQPPRTQAPHQRTRTQAALLTRISRRQQIRSNLNIAETSKTESDIYCVICQERPKCILALPCRHVCMCDECNLRLQLYNNICPICRNDIEETMKVFV